jgi:hypothetical protein
VLQVLDEVFGAHDWVEELRDFPTFPGVDMNMGVDTEDSVLHEQRGAEE